jgi:hypothetical protein
MKKLYWGYERHIQGFGGETRGKRPLRRPRCSREENIKIYIYEIGFGVWSGLICLRIGEGGWGGESFGCDDEPSSSIKCGEFLH